MQTIGERLEEARKRRGITIREAAEVTKIRGDYLNSFENNQFQINIPEIYTRGFLRTYANFLKINADKLVTDYNASLISEGKMPKRDSREFFGRVELPPSLAEDEGDAPPPIIQESVDEGPRRPGDSQLPGFLSFLDNIDKGLAIKLSIIIGAAIVTVVVLVLIVRSFITADTPTSVDPMSDVSAEDQTFAPVERESIRLIATGDVRVRVTQVEPRQIIFEGPLAEGEEREIYKTGKVIISYNAGQNLIIEKDGNKFAGADGAGRSPFE